MSSSETASAFLHGIHMDIPNNPPPYNDVIKMSHLPTAPLLHGMADIETPFSSIFGAVTSVKFDNNASSIGSFFIRDTDGSLQAKGDTNNHHIVVHHVNGMEMLKIIERSVNEVDGAPVRTYGVIHKHAVLGTIKVAESSSPSTSLQIIRANGLPITVNSLKLGDYTVFRKKSLATPLCNIQMPDVEVSNPTEFNIKIIFHPHTGITEEEQLLCTAAAIAFKTAMKQKVEIVAENDRCMGCVCGIIIVFIFLLIMALFIGFLSKHSCEMKKARGYAGYQNC